MPPPHRPCCWRPLDHQKHNQAFFSSGCTVSVLPPQGYVDLPGLFPVPVISAFVYGTPGQLLLCEALSVEPALAGLVARNVWAAIKEAGRRCCEQHHHGGGHIGSLVCLLLQPQGFCWGTLVVTFIIVVMMSQRRSHICSFFHVPTPFVTEREFGGCPKLTIGICIWL